MQMAFYLWLMNRANMPVEHAILEYPKQRRRSEFHYDSRTEARVEAAIEEIRVLLTQDSCPPLLNSRICKSCAFHDFCYA